DAAGGFLTQPMSSCYTGLHGMPMGRQHRPLVALYVDLDFLPHIRAFIAQGVDDAVVNYGTPLAIDGSADRKTMTTRLETVIRGLLVAALRGRPVAALGVDET